MEMERNGMEIRKCTTEIVTTSVIYRSLYIYSTFLKEEKTNQYHCKTVEQAGSLHNLHVMVQFMIQPHCYDPINSATYYYQ